MAFNLISGSLTVNSWLKAAAPLQRLSDGGGLYLLIPRQDGSAGWRLDYTFETKRKTLSLGTYPDTGLALAREKAAEARAMIAAGQDPSQARKDKRAQHLKAIEAAKLVKEGKPAIGSVEEVARRWYDTHLDSWAESYSPKILRRLEMYVFPRIGPMAIGDVQPPQIVELCRGVEQTGALESTHRVLKLCSMIFDFAIAEGTRTTSNPCGGVRRALKVPARKNFPAITKPHELMPLLRAIEGYHGSFSVRCALQLAPMLMVRPGELRQAEWQHIDLTHGQWYIPAEQMKGTLQEKSDGAARDEDHFVPLPRQAIKILEKLFALTGHTGIVFPCVGRKGRFMSAGTVNAALRSMGYDTTVVTGHGFRATARTILVQDLGYSIPVVEMQLAHVVPDLNGTAYNRAEYITARQTMVQGWADYLEKLRLGRVKNVGLPTFTPVTQRLKAPRHADGCGAA